MTTAGAFQCVPASTGSRSGMRCMLSVSLLGTIMDSMAEEFRMLPSAALARASRDCPLLESESNREAWVVCCTQRFLPMAKRLGGGESPAEDILQESWIRVLEHVCAYRGDTPACSWVRAIVRNCALDLRRKQRPMDREPGTDIDDPSRNPEALAQQRELLALLREMVASLPVAYRDVCEMRFGQDLSTAETAHRLGISPSNVSTRLYRAVRMLRSSLDSRLREQP